MDRITSMRVFARTANTNSLSAAARHLGMSAAMATKHVNALERGELVELTLDKPTIKLGGIHVLYPPDRRPPAKVRVMVDYLVEILSKSGH